MRNGAAGAAPFSLRAAKESGRKSGFVLDKRGSGIVY